MSAEKVKQFEDLVRNLTGISPEVIFGELRVRKIDDHQLSINAFVYSTDPAHKVQLREANQNGDAGSLKTVAERKKRILFIPIAKKKRASPGKKASEESESGTKASQIAKRLSINRRFTTSDEDITLMRQHLVNWKVQKKLTDNQIRALDETSGIRLANISEAQREQILDIFEEVRESVGIK